MDPVFFDLDNDIENITLNRTVNPFTYGLNYSLIDSADYSEDVKNNSTIERNPLVSSILHKLKSRYKKLIKKESINDLIKDDFFNFLDKEDELMTCLNDLVYSGDSDDILSDLEEIKEDVNDLLGENMTLNRHLNVLENKKKNKVLKESINNIKEDCNVDFDKTIIDLIKLKNYQNHLAQDYIVFRTEIKNKINNIDKKIKGLKAIENIFDFDDDDSKKIEEMIEKYINDQDVIDLIKKYIPIKIKLYLLISISNNYKNDVDCRVCLMPNKNLFAVSNCGHVFCENCINVLDRCPLCRLPIDNRIKLYL